jgi:SAM-dependent methyltransferase
MTPLGWYKRKSNHTWDERGFMRAESPDSDQRPDLVVEQYRDDRRLQSRYAVHEKFSVAKRDYLTWIFDHLLQEHHRSIFDLGCGPGYLWQHNLHRIPKSWSLILGDPSRGMLAKAKNGLRNISRQTEFVQLEGERLPFSDNDLDAVSALHVLHLLQDLTATLVEVERVLRPGGRLYAATNGELHMHEFREALNRFGVETEYFRSNQSFTVQKGCEQLLELFDLVDVIHFEDGLEVTEVAPLLEYVKSGIPEEQLPAQQEALGRLEHYWEQELHREGAIHIQKETGLFIAR